MPTPRRLLVDPATSGVFHCVSRCVRRAALCGRDPYSGQDYEHRQFCSVVKTIAPSANRAPFPDTIDSQLRAMQCTPLSPG